MKNTIDHAEVGKLVQQIQDGDLQAQGELITLTQARLFKFCLLLVQSRELAEDITQETYIKAFQNIKKIKNPSTFVGWMFQIAKNIFIDLKRSPSQRETSTDEVHEASQTPTEGMEVVLSVQKVLSQFEPEDRLLLLLVELEGCSYAEAAEILKLSEDAVRSRLHRLRALFIKKYHPSETKDPSDSSSE